MGLTSLDHITTGNGMPAFDYSIECGERATLTVTKAASAEHGFAVYGNFQDNPSAEDYVISFEDEEDVLLRPPNLSLVLAAKHETSQIIDAIQPGRRHRMAENQPYEILVMSGVVHTIIQLRTDALDDPERRESLMRRDALSGSGSWAAKYLAMPSASDDLVGLSAHNFVDTAFIAARDGMVRYDHMSAMESGGSGDTDTAFRDETEIQARCAMLDQTLHVAFCNVVHPPAPAMHNLQTPFSV